MSKSVVVFSGGLDSTATLGLALKQADSQVTALFFDYGQRHLDREYRAAKAVCRRLEVPLVVKPLRGLFGASSALLGDSDIPLSDYDEATMSSTEVMGRNLLFASIGIALSGRGGEVWLGVHGGDHDLYPDCRPEFWEHVKPLARAYGSQVLTPFLTSTKAQITQTAQALGLPLELTYSCYQGGEEHCGQCGTCLERRGAFKVAGVEDLTKYAHWDSLDANDAPNLSERQLMKGTVR